MSYVLLIAVGIVLGIKDLVYERNCNEELSIVYY